MSDKLCKPCDLSLGKLFRVRWAEPAKPQQLQMCNDDQGSLLHETDTAIAQPNAHGDHCTTCGRHAACGPNEYAQAGITSC
jgi:hypothetical protein